MPTAVSHAEDGIQMKTAPDHIGGYDRSLFKHWIDADKNGCDTRKEVLIAEATIKPKVGAKCLLSGGKWTSAYDGITYTKDAGLDIDHVVPLAEAWRSGAWAWTAQQRQDFANDLTDSRVLIAVTASANRSKGDQDVKTWLPAKNKCSYVEMWVAVKIKYSLTFDSGELLVIQSYLTSCPITNISVSVLPDYETVTNQVAPKPEVTPISVASPISIPTANPSRSPTVTTSVTPSPTVTASATQTPTATQTVIPTLKPTTIATPTTSASPTPVATVTPTPVATVSPGAFCAPAGATGKSSAGVSYTCKTSATDSRNRWRP